MVYIEKERGKGSAPNILAMEEYIHLFEKDICLFALDDELDYLCNHEDTEFNIFQIMRIDQEMQFSFILKFLLNPRENHKIGHAFLDSLLYTMNQHLNSKIDVDIEVDKVRLHDELSAPTINVEHNKHRRADLVIKTNKWLMVIENKIRSSSISDPEQIKDMYKQFAGNKPLFVLAITPKEHPKYIYSAVKMNSRIVNITWGELHAILTNILRNEHISDKFAYVLKDFIVHIEKIILEAENNGD